VKQNYRLDMICKFVDKVWNVLKGMGLNGSTVNTLKTNVRPVKYCKRIKWCLHESCNFQDV